MNCGMNVTPSGEIQLSGKTFFGAGVNCFPVFLRHKNTGDDEHRKNFDLINKYQIPFVRIPLCGFWPSEFTAYTETPEKYFAAMDNIISEAEKNRVGIIASLMWWDPAVSDFVGEHRKSMGDPNSKTVAYAKKYVTDVVTRYKGSPAVWGWEIGNEYNLSADLFGSPDYYPMTSPAGGTPESRSEEDCLTSTDIHDFYVTIGNVIREIDPFRMITSGDGEMRSAAWHLRHEGTSETDTFEQFTEMLEYFTPAPLDTVCFHLQHNLMEFDRWGKKGIDSYTYFKGFADAARSLGKAIYYGEFGDMMEWHELGGIYKDNPELLEKNFYTAVKAIEDSGIQLSSIWMFRYENEYHKITDGGDEGFKFKEVGEMNRRYREKGLQDFSAYWNQF